YLQAVGRVDYKVLVSLIIAIPFTILLADYGFQELGLFSEPRGDGQFSTSFRVILLSEGFKLAVENFPFGTGLASFGTPFALDVGVYEETGIRGMFFLNQGTALFDNNFASILGETGFLGLPLVLLLIWVVVWTPL